MVQISEKKEIQLMDYNKNGTAYNDKYETYIEQNTLITLNFKQGKTTSTEYYRVLSLFTKHYSEWLVELNKKSSIGIRSQTLNYS